MYVTVHVVIPVTVELVQPDSHRMPRGRTGVREIAVDKKERKKVSSG
jgi:hypothetical protein